MNSLDVVMGAAALTVGALSILFTGAVSCTAISIYLINKFGDDSDTN